MTPDDRRLVRSIYLNEDELRLLNELEEYLQGGL
jgi:hypothetical protein